MSRAILCFIVIGLFLNFIQTSQADDTTTEKPEETKKDANVTPTPKEENVARTGSEDAKTPKPDGDAKKGFLPDLKSLGSGSKVLEPVNSVRGRISEAVSKGMDSAKGMADGAYHFVKEAVTTFI